MKPHLVKHTFKTFIGLQHVSVVTSNRHLQLQIADPNRQRGGPVITYPEPSGT